MAGVAVMGIAGYLVAALWLFPAPLLHDSRAVARVTGLGEAEARQELSGQGFTVAVEYEPHPRAPSSAVTWQDPMPGVELPRGSLVTLTVSSGYSRVTVPDVELMDQDLARRVLLAAGLQLDAVDSATVPNVPAGLVVRTDPAAGDSVMTGRGVILYLARSQF